jgi:EmrB/QacA subfamily drug resistance transporter
LTLLAVALGVMMVGLDATVVSIANPAIARDLHATLADLQWVTNGYLLALAVSLITAGKLADRLGRKRIFLTGVVAFALASTMVGLSGSISMVILWRVVQGLAGALLQPSSLAILRNAFPAEKLNMAVGIWGGTSGLAIASGPIIGGLLVQHVNWQSVFYVNVLVGVLALVVGAWVIRESRARDQVRSFDMIGVLLSSAAMFALVWGIIKAQAYGWGDAYPLGFFGGAIVLFALFVVRERLARGPLIPLGLFRSASLSASVALVLMVSFALFGVLFFLVLYMQQVHGMSPVQAGVRILPLTAVFVFSAPLGGALTQRLGPRPPIVFGMLAVSVSLFGLAGISVDAAYIALWPWFALLGIGMGFVIVAATEAIVGNAPLDLSGVASGLQQTAMQVGGVLGTAVLGSVMSTRVTSTIVSHLTASGVAPAQAAGGRQVVPLIAQGVVPVPPGAPASVAAAFTNGAHAAFMDGLHLSMLVGAVVALAGALIGLIVRRGHSPTSAPAAL